jgi:hypothetical protein
MLSGVDKHFGRVVSSANRSRSDRRLDKLRARAEDCHNESHMARVEDTVAVCKQHRADGKRFSGWTSNTFVKALAVESFNGLEKAIGALGSVQQSPVLLQLSWRARANGRQDCLEHQLLRVRIVRVQCWQEGRGIARCAKLPVDRKVQQDYFRDARETLEHRG